MRSWPGLIVALALSLSTQSMTMPASGAKGENAVSEPSTGFGLSMLQSLQAGSQNSNVFISPFSISTALSLAAAGAKGTTKEEIDHTLMCPECVAHYTKLLNRLVGADPKVQFEIANAMFVSKDVKLNDAYMQKAQSEFHAVAHNEDFGSPSAISHINSWVAEKTHEKIPSIISKLSPKDVAVLLNAIYFKAKWTVPFQGRSTTDAVFHAHSGDKTVKMMHATREFEYMETDKFQAVTMPYGTQPNPRYEAVVFLPAKGESPQTLGAKLSQSSWKELFAGFQTKRGSLALPKFKTEFSAELSDNLKSLGMPLAFSDHADFSAMHTPPPPLKIGKVIHKAFVAVDEEGTEAAAATAVVMMEAMARRMEPGFAMIVDRPFLFAIRDRSTGTLMFLGSIYDPS